jgi:hypothetical protein
MPQTTNPYLYWGPNNTPYQVPGTTISPFRPAPTVIQHIYQPGAIQTMDASSFHEFAEKNSAAIGNAAATNIQDHGESSRLGAAIKYVAR